MESRHEKDEKTRPGCNLQFTISGYTIATHGYIINKQDKNECPFCNVRLTVDYILWDCKVLL
jgi:hypothetical protein